MKTTHTIIATLASAFALAMAPQAQAISTVTDSNANTLASTILGSGITITSASFTGAAASAGTFTGGMAALGIDQGIVLTSGFVSNITSVNTQEGITGDNGLPGWAPLSALNPGYSTRDAAILHIDFTTNGGDLYFNYVFGSDEYNEFVGTSYNDVFGFFVDGTSVSSNIARLPNGLPVSINNVNLGSNAAFYKNNSGNGAYPIEYDGLTTVLQAKALGLGAGTHTIDIAIADAGDYVLDSGVFIQGGSFSDDDHVPDIGSTFGMLMFALISIGTLRRKLGI